MAIQLSDCRNCGRRLDFSQIVAPRFGLVEVNCERCHHSHLYSPAELASARARIRSDPGPYQPPLSVRLQLRRLWSA